MKEWIRSQILDTKNKRKEFKKKNYIDIIIVQIYSKRKRNN